MQTRRIIRILLNIMVVSFFLLHSVGVLNLEFIGRLENIAYDLRLKNTLLNTVDERISIIDLDEKSLTEIGHWPWGRNILAEMVNTLYDYYDIKALGFDVTFPEVDESSGIRTLENLATNELKDNTEYVEQFQAIKPSLEYDKLFSESIKGRNVVLGFVFTPHEKKTIGMLPNPTATIEKQWKKQINFNEAKGYTANLEILQQNAFAAGFFDNPLVDDDGVFRKVPLLQEYNGAVYESLALALTRAALNSPTITLIIETSEDKKREYRALERIVIGKYEVLIDEQVSVLVPYRGAEQSFEYISAADIIHRRVPKNKIKDKIILVGTTAPGLLDLRSTPVQNIYPGVEVHANIISGILDERIKHEPAYSIAIQAVQIVVVGGLMIYLLSFLSPLWISTLSAGLLLIVTAINILIWNNGNVVIPLASPLLLVICLFVLQMSYGFFVEARGKRAISKLFGQYIPPELVDEMNEDPGDLTLEGQSRDMSVLFSDVRGFTTISEGLDPKELTQLMNEILTPMTLVIHKHRGTIDKYMGDAIMAFWGAPLVDPYHAKNALLASMEMIEVLDELQPTFKERGWPEIRVGIGINSGIMSVGNMGSQFRMAYTVMGDTVNLGSRLEGLTKQYGVSIIVNESTKEAVPEYEYLELDKVRVKGKDEPVTIYEPLGFSIELDKTIKSNTRRFNQALRLYREQNWDSAEREIFSLSQQYKGKRLYKLYLDRIMYYRNNPPGADWDGVFTHTTK